MPEIAIQSIKTWICRGIDKYGIDRIWFKASEDKPTEGQEFEHSKWEYFCDGKLCGQELEQFMMKHRRLCTFKQENGLCKECDKEICNA